ncbi:hypothetical protein VTO73DRAFT_2408 [Trametes versicolor]
MYSATNTVLKPTAAESVIHQQGLNRKHIFDSVNASSKCLQLEYIDVLQCHRLQLYHADRGADGSTCPALRNPPNNPSHLFFVPVIQMQSAPLEIPNDHSPMYRKEEREMFPTLKMFGVGSIPWSPLARGLLSRPNAASSKRGDTDPYVHPPFPLRSQYSVSYPPTSRMRSYST